MATQSKFLAVEGIRGIACFMVLLSHLSLIFFPFLHAFEGTANPALHPTQALLHNLPLGFLYSGTSAVYIFFVLSGFILTKVALRGKNIPKTVLSMSIKRYPRLMLPALASSILAYAVFLLLPLSSPLLSDWIHKYGDFSSSFLGAIYSGAVDVFFLSGKSLYNPVLWTMKIELIGSVIIYLLCLNRATLKSCTPFLFFTAMTVMFTGLKIIEPKLGLGLVSFLGGYLFCIYGQKMKLMLSMLMLATGLFLAGAHNESASYTLIKKVLGTHTYQLCNFVSGFLIVYSIIFSTIINNFFSKKFIVFMGKVSFSVYLIHLPILSTVGVFLFNMFYQYCEIYTLAAFASSILSIIITYGTALGFYNAVDSQGMKISNKLAHYITSRKRIFRSK